MKRYISEKEEKYYTHMLKLINAIGGRDLNYNWLITDIEAYPQDNGELDKLITESKYLFLSTDEMINILEKNDFQWIWAVFSLIPKKYSKEEILKFEMPFAENNNDIYEDDPIIQHPLAEIEIDAVDSTFVQIISNDNRIMELFKKVYPNARENY